MYTGCQQSVGNTSTKTAFYQNVPQVANRFVCININILSSDVQW